MRSVYTAGGNMSVRRFGAVLLQATGRAPITEREWAHYVELMVADIEEQGVAPCSIQHSPHQSPSPAQIRTLTAAFERLPPQRPLTRGESPAQHKRFALVSGSAVLRALMALIRWRLRVATELRMFAPGLEREALAWLRECAPFDPEAALALLRADVAAVEAGRAAP